MTNPIDFISAIHNEGIKYLLIGRQAMIVYGIAVATMDYDFYIDGCKENTKKFLDCAKRFDLYPSIKEEDLTKHFMFRLENDIVIDVFRPKNIVNSEGEIMSFNEIYERRKVFEDKDGFAVCVPCISDLIGLKKTGREKDIMDIEFLKKI